MVRGRKSKVQMWMPRQADLFGPFSSELITGMSSTPLSASIDYLTNLDIYQPSQNRDCAVLYQFMRWAVSDVARRKWGANIQQLLRGKPLEGKMLELVRKEGALLTKLLNLVSEVHLLNPQNHLHAAFWWLVCVLESECTSIVRYESKEDAPSWKRDYMSDYEGITAALRRQKNPFTKPYTRRLFDEAVKIAKKSSGAKADEDLFTAKAYKPYLDARSDIATFLRKKGTDKLLLKA